ncbi:hypothetical protein DFP72DRAFT_1084620 [Ephemerocybe angulata]|uniref:Uncharacterized protein n=1 Tax=Ephemerocybe angulata TaxID=980116 RepID=A0A8H6H676_9AGAR|nr:hypothetical protein DFP72DRAFT_1084620 [Tulosesus angulatus]
MPPAGARSSGLKRPGDEVYGLGVGPARKQNRPDPLTHHGRHFGRTVQTFCRVQLLIKTGLEQTIQMELGRMTLEDLSASEKADHNIYQQLLRMVPGLEERLCTSSNHDLFYVADTLSKGIASSRSDDTKSLKSVVVDWITPLNGVLVPPISRNVKTDRGYHHPRTGELLCPVNLDWNDPKIRRDLSSGQLVPSGDLWPRFIFRGYEYVPSEPWQGLLRSSLLVSAYKHVFTSPSSVGAQNCSASRATRSSNARIHGMQSVTIASIAYIATQVRFALSSTPVFSRNDNVTDSEFFYNLVIELLEDPEETVEVQDLLLWWNKQIFPTYLADYRPVHQDSVIAKIKERRRMLLQQADKEAVAAEQNGGSTSNPSP